MWRVWVILGSAVWVATIGASGAVNYLAGQEFGRTPVEAQVFAVLGLAADAWKAVGPIFIVTLVRGRRIVAAGIAGAVWTVCFVFAVSAALGLAAQNRSALTGGREAVRLSYESVSRELTDLEAKRAAVGAVRSLAESEGAINVALAKPLPGGTVGSLSGNCSKDHWRTRSVCADIAQLRNELSRSLEAQRLEERIAVLKREVASLRERGGTRDSDPQATLISRLTFGRVAAGDVGLVLTLVLVSMVELISAFAPVVLHEFVTATKAASALAATGRDGSQQDAACRAVPLLPGTLGEVPRLLQKVGGIFEYMAERVLPAEKGVVPGAALFVDYQAWCSENGFAPMRLDRFVDEMDVIAERDLRGRIRRQGREYHGLRLAVAALPGQRRARRGTDL